MSRGADPRSSRPAARRGSARVRLLAGVAFVAVLASTAAYLLQVGASLESASVSLRFALRPATHHHGLVIVAVDDRTLNTLHLRWPFPRSIDARAIDELSADGARTIVYDVQFTQPTDERDDLALYHSIARARDVVLATTEIGAGGKTEVLGGNANVAKAHARAGAANFHANSDGVIQKYARSVGGLSSLAVVGAEAASGRRVPRRDFEDGSAWIDFGGPVGAIPSVSFSDLVEGKVKQAQLAGKIVVIGATSPVLQDVHSTSTTSSSGMSGPEVQANAIWTALHGNPLREAPGWLAILAIVLGGAAAPLACMKLSPGKALGLGLLLAAVYAIGVQLAFDAGRILVLIYPLVAIALGALGALVVSYCVESWDRRLAEFYGATLEATVQERTAELRDTQLEVIRRLAQAAELRDDDTGLHIERVGRICEQLALQAGLTAEEAERLRIASALHDVGKIGVPDRILLKAGELDESEWKAMQAHTTTGAGLLSGSRSPLIQMAETIARTHHERWDGSGYPQGLSGDEIPLVGRICAICDVFDALTARRPYKDPWPFDRVVKEIVRKRGTHFDPELVDAFVRIVPALESEYTPTATVATPSSGRTSMTRS